MSCCARHEIAVSDTLTVNAILASAMLAWVVCVDGHDWCGLDPCGYSYYIYCKRITVSFHAPSGPIDPSQTWAPRRSSTRRRNLEKRRRGYTSPDDRACRHQTCWPVSE